MRVPGVAPILVPLALHALAREVDRAVGALLHTTLDLPDFVAQALALVDVPRAALHALGYGAVGLVASALLGRELAARASVPFLLRPALTCIALLSLLARPTYPYGFTFPVALTQDLGLAQDAAALAAALAAIVPESPRLKWMAPRAGEVFFACFLGYALIVPEWARSWDGHPGNEPKYLRMALALGHRLTLDVDAIDDPMEWLPVRPLTETAPRALAALAGESARLVASLPGAFGARAIRASRVSRQTIRGKDGGVFHVLAPGPSFLLAPLLRMDRALNLARGTPGRLSVSILAWNALGASLVAALYLLLRDASADARLATGLAFFAALIPPFVFYPFQFFPEMPGALCLTLALRTLLFRDAWDVPTLRRLSLVLAAMPWLHQKFLPVWGLMVLIALYRVVDAMLPLRALAWLVLPQATTLWLTALYNFAITGSVRPDAMFLAWGPAGVTSEHIGQGFLGLLLDARYGVLPYAPIYLLAGAGLLMAGRGAVRLRSALPIAAIYYLTVASADDWHGAVSNLGRYFMPVAPYALALAAVAVAGSARRGGALLVALALGAITACWARALWLDPLAANDASRLLARSAFADGSVYVPDLFIRSFAEGAPGLFVRLACWVLLGAAIALFFKRAAGGSAASPVTALFASTALVLALAAVLERTPAGYAQARFPDAIQLRSGTVAFVAGDARVEQGRLWAHGGSVELLVRSRVPLGGVGLRAFGEGEIRVPGRAATAVGPRGAVAFLPLPTFVELRGRQGVSETLYRQRLEVRAAAPLAIGLSLE